MKVVWSLLVLMALGAAHSSAGARLDPNFLTIAGVAFFCEFINGAFGMGFGTLLAPALIWMGRDPNQVVFSILASELISGFVAAYFHNDDRNIDFREPRHRHVALILSIGCSLGVFLGVPTALQLQKGSLILVTGIVIVISGLAVLYLSDRKGQYKNRRIFGLSIIAAFNKSLTGGGFGPLLTSGQILGGISGKAAAAITSLTKGVTGCLGVTLYLSRGLQIPSDLVLAILAGSLLSVPLATGFIKRFHERRVKGMIAAVTIAMGLLTVLKAVLS